MSTLNWFNENDSLDNISLLELTKTINEKNRQLKLPAFQRDAIWDENRIQVLWDSIIRGFPVGTLLFAYGSHYQNLGTKAVPIGTVNAPAKKLFSKG